MARNPPVVIDIGSGCTKMGFAGNIEPTLVIPTYVANAAKKTLHASVHISQAQTHYGIADADFYIGDDAFGRKDSPNYLLSSPVVKGRIEHWDDMERFLQQALFRNLRCTPEEHEFLLTEPPFNTPENRELMAEMMFETFNVKGLHIGVQAVLALYAQWVTDVKIDSQAMSNPNLTGLVVDSGDGLSHVIPVADGYVISSCIQELAIAGKHVTQFVNDMLCDRGEPVPPEQRMEAARIIKEKHAYLCRDVVEEYQKFDQDPRKFKSLSGVFPKTKQAWSIQVGYERFLAPEIFFHPEIFVESVTTPLPQVVDNCISQCPIDYRRRLYSNIVLSGGSTTFQHFKERLQHDLQSIVDARLMQAQLSTGIAPQAMEVRVHGGRQRKQQRYAAWLGGSLLAQEAHFLSMCKTKREYEEVGPSCMRSSPVLLG
eukprot:TRINITY_DN60595_c0_g1_i1.p1 TRINITY_DN60595_c0_g1~~TRINITY_DN60595_c0_g1_i1.p1  ORF type:complete len:462 (+),score=108.80 TRINITY_DN60595_c0_g1_i1:104-1387(+)